MERIVGGKRAWNRTTAELNGKLSSKNNRQKDCLDKIDDTEIEEVQVMEFTCNKPPTFGLMTPTWML